jgi:hypothetical protein
MIARDPVHAASKDEMNPYSKVDTDARADAKSP